MSWKTGTTFCENISDPNRESIKDDKGIVHNFYIRTHMESTMENQCIGARTFHTRQSVLSKKNYWVVRSACFFGENANDVNRDTIKNDKEMNCFPIYRTIYKTHGKNQCIGKHIIPYTTKRREQAVGPTLR